MANEQPKVQVNVEEQQKGTNPQPSPTQPSPEEQKDGVQGQQPPKGKPVDGMAK